MPHEFDIWCTGGLAVMSSSFLCVFAITLHFFVKIIRNFGCKGLLLGSLAIFSALTMILSAIYVAIDCFRIYNGFMHQTQIEFILKGRLDLEFRIPVPATRSINATNFNFRKIDVHIKGILTNYIHRDTVWRSTV